MKQQHITRHVIGRHIAGRASLAILASALLATAALAAGPSGTRVVRDPETGRTREFTTTEQLRADYARAATEHRDAVRRAVRSCGAPLLSLRTDRNWIDDVVRFVAARRHSFGAPVKGAR